MDFQNIKKKMESMILEVDDSNFNEYFDKFSEIIESYRSHGGLGKPLYEFLISLDKKYGSHNKGREEILIDTLNRLSGFTSPWRSIIFEDYDSEKGEWKNTI